MLRKILNTGFARFIGLLIAFAIGVIISRFFGAEGKGQLTLLLLVPLFSKNVTLTQKEMINIANNIKELQADSARIANSLSICDCVDDSHSGRTHFSSRN